MLTLGQFERKPGSVEIMFDDHSDAPFALHLDPQQRDRTWKPEDEGKEIPFVIYRSLADRIERTCWLRRTGRLPYMQPLRTH